MADDVPTKTVVVGRIRPAIEVESGGTAAERVEMDLKKWVGLLALLVVGGWLVLGFAHHYGFVKTPPPLWGGDRKVTANAFVPPPSARGTRFSGLTDFDEQPRGRPVIEESVGDLPTLIAQASRGSRCDPRGLELSARHLYDVPGQIVAVRLNEGQCNYTARIVNRN